MGLPGILRKGRSSGSSYINRVELQNGCLSLRHSNLCIPSNLGGSVVNPDTGSVDMDRVAKKKWPPLYILTDPCSDTVIHVFSGADSSTLKKSRGSLMIFLKALDEPELYAHFKMVTEVKEIHKVRGLPAQYLYMLL